MSTTLADRIRRNPVGPQTRNAMEVIDHALQMQERGEITTIEAIDELLGEEYASRDTPTSFRTTSGRTRRSHRHRRQHRNAGGHDGRTLQTHEPDRLRNRGWRILLRQIWGFILRY